jgi:endonuclease G
VLAAPYANPPRGIAFLYPNMTAPGNMENYAMTIRELESLTGFDFLYNLPDSIEELVETTASFKEWNKR